MIPDSREIIRALQGVWLLARFDPEGMNWFNLTLEGFWRSFFVAVLVAPFVALSTVVLYDGSDVSPFVIVVLETATYVLSWVLFPLAMLFVARMLNLSATYVGFIIAYNWSYVVSVVVFTPLALAAAYTGPTSTIAFLELSAIVYLLLLSVFIARTALATTLAIGISVAALDLLLGLSLVLATADLV